MADTTIRLEFKDETPQAGAAPTTPEPTRNYLTGEVQKPQAEPVAAPGPVPTDLITPAVYKSYSDFERKLADRLMAEGQLRMGEDEEAPVELTPAQGEKATREQEKQDRLARKVAKAVMQSETQPVGLEEMQAKGERETRQQEEQDRLARKVAKSMIEASEAEIPVAEQVGWPTGKPAGQEELKGRRQGERDAREKEEQDRLARKVAKGIIESEVPEALPVEQEKVSDPMEHLRPIMKMMGFGGTAGLIDKMMGRGKMGDEEKDLRAKGDHEGADAAKDKRDQELAFGAGDIGLAIAAAAQVVRVGADTLRIGMKAHSDTVVELAGNNMMGAFNKQVEGAADTMRQIPIVGGALASTLELAVQPIRSFTDVVEAFVERGRELSKYSGPLSAANAQADVRSLFSDIREAQELGPDMAELTDLESKGWNDMREILLPLKKAILEDIIPIMRMIADTLHVVKESSSETKEAALAGALAQGQAIGGITGMGIQLAATYALLAEWRADQNKDDAKDPLGIVTIFDAHFHGPGGGAPVPKAAAPMPVLPHL